MSIASQILSTPTSFISEATLTPANFLPLYHDALLQMGVGIEPVGVDENSWFFDPVYGHQLGDANVITDKILSNRNFDDTAFAVQLRKFQPVSKVLSGYSRDMRVGYDGISGILSWSDVDADIRSLERQGLADTYLLKKAAIAGTYLKWELAKDARAHDGDKSLSAFFTLDPKQLNALIREYRLSKSDELLEACRFGNPAFPILAREVGISDNDYVSLAIATLGIVTGELEFRGQKAEEEARAFDRSGQLYLAAMIKSLLAEARKLNSELSLQFTIEREGVRVVRPYYDGEDVLAATDAYLLALEHDPSKLGAYHVIDAIYRFQDEEGAARYFEASAKHYLAELKSDLAIGDLLRGAYATIKFSEQIQFSGKWKEIHAKLLSAYEVAVGAGCPSSAVKQILLFANAAETFI